MLKLEEKKYDLNNLLGLNFDMLREVLIKLAQSQNNLENEIKGIKDRNVKRDKKISSLEKIITELYNNNKYNIKENPLELLLKETPKQTSKKEHTNDKINKEKNIKDKNSAKENIKDENIQEKNIKDQNVKAQNIKDENIKDDNNKEQNIKDENIKENNNNKYKHSESNNNNIYKNELIKENSIIPKEELNTIKENKPNTDRANNRENNEIFDDNKEDNNEMIKNYTYYKEKEKDKEQDKDKNINKENNDIDKDKDKDKEKRPTYKTSQDIIDLNSAVLHNTQTSYELVRNMVNKLTDMNEKIKYIEENINKKFNECLETAKDLLSEHNVHSISRFNSIDKKLKDLYSKKDDFDIRIDELALKIEELPSKSNQQIIQIFNEEENKDEKKYMSSTFKESINKKFDLNDNRYMKAADDNHKLKQNLLKLEGFIDRINRQINLLKRENKMIKDNIELNKKNTNELIDNKNNEIKNDIKEQIDKIINDINNKIDKKVRELLDGLLERNSGDNNEIINKKDDTGNNFNEFKIDNALIKLLNKKANELSEKLEKMEEDFGNYKKKNGNKYKEIDDIKQCVVELYDNINNKIGKNDLKELYGFYLDHVNEIKYLRSKIAELSELQDKMRNETPNFIKRLESLTHDVSELQENESKKVITYNEKQIDLSNYITEKKLKNSLSPIAEEIQKLISELQYITFNIKEISEQIQLFDKKEHVDHIESDLNEKMNILNNKCTKKYIEKIEFNKIIKNIDIQLKLLQGNNNPKQEADSWILAKQPIKCFNCATCEANIANLNPPKEYLPWNKYPYGDKQYRIGQGFSKLLKKLNKNDDNNKNDKKNKLSDNSIDNDPSKLIFNSLNNINDIIKINNRMSYKEDRSVSLNIKKYKLPKVIENFRKKHKSIDVIPLTDDEKENEEEIIGNEIEVNSPKILKITKIKNESEQTINDQVSNNLSRNKTGRNSANKFNKLNRIQSVPLY